MNMNAWLYPPLRTVFYNVRSPLITQRLRLAVVSDLHNGTFDAIKDELAASDAVLVPGDLANRHKPGLENVKAFLEEVPALAPTFVSLGNHEWRSRESDQVLSLIDASEATLLDNRWVNFRGIVLGGVSSATVTKADFSFLPEMVRQPGFRLLLCHHPEWYRPCIRPFDIQLTIAGHAHGGQVQLGGRGIYSPGQGLLPQLTRGFYDGQRLLVSAGITNSNNLPRIGNPTELLILTLEPGPAGVWHVPYDLNKEENR